MTQLLLPTALALLIIFVVPFLVYGLAAVIGGVKAPEGISAAQFQFGVLISKLGTAVAFVLIFYFARATFSAQWPLYALLWWVSFFTGEIGETICGKYTWKEAVCGVISETIYLPLSAYVVHRLIGAA